MPSFTPASHCYMSPLTFPISFNLFSPLSLSSIHSPSLGYHPLCLVICAHALPHPSCSLTHSLCHPPCCLSPPPFFFTSPFFSFPHSPPSYFLLLGHFRSFLRVTPHELFTCACQWGFLQHFTTVCCSKTDKQCFLKGKKFVSPLNAQVAITDVHTLTLGSSKEGSMCNISCQMCMY